VDGELIGLLGDLTDGAVTDANLSVDDSLGLAIQAGIDYPLTENLALNLAVWYIDINTTAVITAKADGVTAAKVKFDLELDPWVYNIGIAYKL
jgi:outer membrane protein